MPIDLYHIILMPRIERQHPTDHFEMKPMEATDYLTSGRNQIDGYSLNSGMNVVRLNEKVAQLRIE